VTTTAEMNKELLRLIRLLDKGVQALTDAGREYAEAVDDYRRAKATAYLSLDEGTVAGRQAKVDDRCGVERRRKLLAEGMRQAALEAVRSRRSQLSAMQSVAAAFRAEMEFARIGPEMSP